MLTIDTSDLRPARPRGGGLEEWIRSHQRHAVHPVGGAAEIQISRDPCPEERRGLLTNLPQQRPHFMSSDGKNREVVSIRLGWVGGIMGGTLVLVSILAVVLVAFMLVFAHIVTNVVTDAQEAFVPTGMKLLDSVDTIADEAVSILKHGHNVSEQTDNVAAMGAPDILTLLNASAALSTRVQHLLEHPKLEISLHD